MEHHDNYVKYAMSRDGWNVISLDKCGGVRELFDYPLQESLAFLFLRILLSVFRHYLSSRCGIFQLITKQTLALNQK